MLEIVVETAAGRIPVIAGAGSNNTEEAIGLMRHRRAGRRRRGAGGDALLQQADAGGLYAHFTALHDAVELPIIIYNIPGRSVVDMTPETMGELAELPRIVGVKDATGDIGRVSEQRITCGTDFIQLSGEDATALGFNAHGGVGCISVTANVAPRLCAEFQEATLAGDYAQALDLPGPADAAAPSRLRRAEPGAGANTRCRCSASAARRSARRWCRSRSRPATGCAPRCATPACSTSATGSRTLVPDFDRRQIGTRLPCRGRRVCTRQPGTGAD